MTIYDIAKEAGVSPSSVSRVINKKPGVKENTRRRVMELLEEHDFVPNAIAKGLVSKSSKTIGILISDLRVSHHVDGVYHVEKELTDHGYCSLIMNTGSKAIDKVQAIRELERRRVDGLVLMGAVFQCSEVKSAITQYLRDIPVLMVNGCLDLPNVCGVISDEEDATKRCVERLDQLGRSRLAFVCDDGVNPSVEAKRRGYRRAMETLPDTECWIYPAENSYAGGEAATLRVLAEHPEVDGILYSVDLLAAAGIHTLMKSGVSVPERVSVIGMNNSVYAEICSPSITSLDNKRNEASVMAASMLIDKINGQKIAQKVMLFSELIERESTASGT